MSCVFYYDLLYNLALAVLWSSCPFFSHPPSPSPSPSLSPSLLAAQRCPTARSVAYRRYCFVLYFVLHFVLSCLVLCLVLSCTLSCLVLYFVLYFIFCLVLSYIFCQRVCMDSTKVEQALLNETARSSLSLLVLSARIFLWNFHGHCCNIRIDVFWTYRFSAKLGPLLTSRPDFKHIFHLRGYAVSCGVMCCLVFCNIA